METAVRFWKSGDTREAVENMDFVPVRKDAFLFHRTALPSEGSTCQRGNERPWGRPGFALDAYADVGQEPSVRLQPGSASPRWKGGRFPAVRVGHCRPGHKFVP